METDDARNCFRRSSGFRKLLVPLQTLAGYKQKQLAAGLGVSEATMSRVMPKGVGKAHLANG
jgi:transposase